MAMYVGAGVAASVGTGKKIYDYNIENYRYDREMRQKQEFKVVGMRVEQANLWREDVRNIVELTEKKMDTYMVVNCLQLGFTIVLFTEGRLFQGTPQWLVWCYTLSLSGCFMFLLQSIWFAMHASVVAQGNSVRLLTQLVRPPIPSWEQLESMRTYGMSFEGQPVSNMLRVPLIQTMAEGTEPTAGGHSGAEKAPPGTGAADPWGLERRGDDIFELARRPIAMNRHIQLVRQAMIQWQAYDAFARVAMTLGTVLLCTSVCYFVLGYALVQDAAPWAACSSVVVFTAIASFILWIDVTMTQSEYFVAQILLLMGPCLASASSAWWAMYTSKFQEKVELMIGVTYVSHCLFELFFIHLCHVVEQPNGSLMPTSFRSVLYIDVFGWLTYDYTGKGTEGYEAISSFESKMVRKGDKSKEEDKSSSGSDQEDNAYGGRSGAIVAVKKKEKKPKLSKADEREKKVTQAKRAKTLAVVHSQTFPHHSLDPQASVKGHIKACRPDDVDTAAMPDWDPTGGYTAKRNAKKAFENDLHADKSTVKFEGVGPSGIIPEANDEAFSAKTYAPSYQSTTDLTEDAEGYVETGHDTIHAGQLPWQVFKSSVLVHASLWFVAILWATAQFLDLPDIPDKVLPETVTEEKKSLSVEAKIHKIHRPPLLTGAQHIAVKWPNDRFQPKGLSCDSNGREFALADEFQLYFANTIDINAGRSIKLSRFKRAPKCLPLEGESIRDIALLRVSSVQQSVFVLHDHGYHMAECFLGDSASKSNTVWSLAHNWLRPWENLVTVAVDGDCHGKSSSTCIVVGTDGGRMVKMRHHLQTDNKLVPKATLFEDTDAPVAINDPESSEASTIQVLPSGHVLVLRNGCEYKCRTIQAINQHDVSVIGEWMLPSQEGRYWSALTGDSSYVYIISLNMDGYKAQLWRFPLPGTLQKKKQKVAKAAAAVQNMASLPDKLPEIEKHDHVS